jgi:hypothetical protein
MKLTRAEDDPTVPAMVFSLFAFAKGVGSMASGPIADQLLKVDILKGGTGGYGVNNYVSSIMLSQRAPHGTPGEKRLTIQGILLIFTGTAILLAGGMGLAFRDSRKPSDSGGRSGASAEGAR